MATDSEIFKTANLLIDTYGEMAPNGAKIKADHLKDKGDIHGQAVWLRIARAVENLLDDRLPKNAMIH
jgi:hypothetical protein